jgi:hypothetical protein
MQGAYRLGTTTAVTVVRPITARCIVQVADGAGASTLGRLGLRTSGAEAADGASKHPVTRAPLNSVPSHASPAMALLRAKTQAEATAVLKAENLNSRQLSTLMSLLGAEAEGLKRVEWIMHWGRQQKPNLLKLVHYNVALHQYGRHREWAKVRELG